MAGGSMQKLFRNLDLYRYRRLFEDDCYTHSWHSYLFTFVAIFTIVFLVTGEVADHFRAKRVTDLYVDDYLDGQLMAVDFDVTIENIPCFYIDVSVSDVTGSMVHNVSKDIVRTRLDHKGRVLGDVDKDQHVDGDENKAGVFQVEEDEYERILADGNFKKDGHVEELHKKSGMVDFIMAHSKPRELVFIDFYAPWCIWCQRLEPVFARLGQELGKTGPIYVGRIDCTKKENEQACVSQHVHSFPTMMFYRHGDEHPFEAYHGERTVEAMKKRSVEIARGDPQSAADKRKAELHKQDGETGPPVAAEMCRISGTAHMHQVPSQMRFHLTGSRHSIDPNKINATHTVNALSFLLDPDEEVEKSRHQRLMANAMAKAITPNFIDRPFKSAHINQTFTHYLKLVPSEHVESSGKRTERYFFSHYGNEHVDADDVASIVLDIDLSAVGLRDTMTYQPFYALLTRLLAVLGGAFSVINVFRGFTAEVVKITMGKQD